MRIWTKWGINRWRCDLSLCHGNFDGNGRTARLFHLWYLVQQGYPAALFTPFSRYIAEHKDAYYTAYERVERNALISGYTDVTPFLFYFCKDVYKRQLQRHRAGPFHL